MTNDLTISAISELTPEIREFVLMPADGRILPAANAGAHIGVETPSGAWRQYSLVHPAKSPASYTIAVKREVSGRGGSQSVHREWQVGKPVHFSGPDNTFALSDAADYLLIAGGIGITPIYAMAQTLVREGRELEMIYCTRSREDTAYANELQAMLGAKLTLHHDNADPGRLYDFWDHFAEPRSTRVFCCGPAAMIEEVKAVSGHWPEGSVQFEDFAGVQAVRRQDIAFDVTLKKSGKSLTVPAHQSILEALRAAGVATVSSCESGTCGTCRCTLVAGEVDHRDLVLMEEEKSANIMICVSRAKSGGLVLDL